MAIFYDQEYKTFYLDGKNITYAFRVNHIGYLEHLYYGSKIEHDYIGYTSCTGAHSFVVTAPDQVGSW